MKRVLLLLFLVSGVASAFSAISAPPPERRIDLSKVSRRILVVEITRVESVKPVMEKGVEVKKLEIEGKVVEVLRGEGMEKGFRDECYFLRVPDHDAYEKANGHEPDDVLLAHSFHQDGGVAECKVGRRYVVIFACDAVFYVRVEKDDESWRKKIVPYSKEVDRLAK